MICKFCGKECKNPNSLRNHERLCKSNPNHQISSMEAAHQSGKHKVKCKFCDREISRFSIALHEKTCINNPENTDVKICPVCFIKFKGTSVTCSHSCSNTYFRSGKNNPNWKDESYRSTCFSFHKKECIICGEENIVAVHHLDEDRSNNSIENLIPLCPTHHQYWHSRFKYIIEDKVLEYLNNISTI